MAADEAAKQQELGNVLTILYLVVEVGRQQAAAGEDATIQQEIGRGICVYHCNIANTTLFSAALRPSLLKFLSQLIARLRWDDTSNIPLTRVCVTLYPLRGECELIQCFSRFCSCFGRLFCWCSVVPSN